MQTSVSRHIPELDGIRGIAIIAVLIHHQLTPFSLSGGFLGVDLFFVLSGYLITSLLLAEFEQTETISLKKFYMRRVLRLGPALGLYLIACLCVTYYTQSMDLKTELKLVGFALAYAANWRMAFGWDMSLDPTAIIWSLSIEEQFYLVWPGLLFACFAFKMKKRSIAIALGVVIAAIFAHRWYLLTSGASLTRLYYGTDTRADALLLGCLSALLPARVLQSRKSWWNVAAIVSAVGVGYLVFASHFTDQFLYQGGFTIVAGLAAVLVVSAANSPPLILGALLRFRVLRWFGEISYGLYLWHWLVVRNTSFYELGYWEPWARLVLAVGISALSFYVVERPFNRLKKHFGHGPSQARPKTESRFEREEEVSSAVRATV